MPICCASKALSLIFPWSMGIVNRCKNNVAKTNKGKLGLPDQYLLVQISDFYQINESNMFTVINKDTRTTSTVHFQNIITSNRPITIQWPIHLSCFSYEYYPITHRNSIAFIIRSYQIQFGVVIVNNDKHNLRRLWSETERNLQSFHIHYDTWNHSVNSPHSTPSKLGSKSPIDSAFSIFLRDNKGYVVQGIQEWIK